MLIRDDRHFFAHLAETDLKDNQRLAESYQQHPLRLVAVIIADVFMDTDIDELARSLDRRLTAPGYNQGENRQRVRDLLRRAQSKSGGREALGAIHFFQPGEGRKYLGGGHELDMPSGVERVGLLLYQFAPGMVMAALVVAAPPDLAATVFARHHDSPVQLTRTGHKWQMVEAAKTRELELRLREFATMNLLPSAHGLLGAKRFPAGTLVVWSGEKYPSADDRDASDVTRVLGIENWFLWWEGDNRRLYPGVPVTDDRRDRG
jgi:hypothetical protein